MVMMLLPVTCMTTYAFVDEPEEAPTEVPVDDPFSVDGNGTVLDNIPDVKSGKEFYTIQTSNNNTYFLVIDHASTTQNVYMLSMIDENDLKEFLTEDEKNAELQNKPSVVLPEETEKEEDPIKAEPETKGGNMGTLLILLVLGGVIVGGYYYVKLYKPKQDGSFADDEDLEYMDDGVTVNEDTLENTNDDRNSDRTDDDDGFYA